jgi:4-amino-4-deoxy-L-arabinose transferase-like glycosyltransferase
MPLTWFTRRILLDSIQLPFLLLSILFATYHSTTGSAQNHNKKNKKNIPLFLLSGIFLGLAIFTKIPAFTMIPLIGYLIYTNYNYKHLNNKSASEHRLVAAPIVTTKKTLELKT